MKAAFIEPDGILKVKDTPIPKPGPQEVLVQVAYCGICGSDIHLLGSGMLPPGCVIGHEFSGRIAAVGKEVEDWREGDPVGVLPINPCFTCGPCGRGDVQLCQNAITRSYGLGGLPGGFSQYLIAHPAMLFRVGPDLDLETAALNEPWSVAVHGVNMSDFKLGDIAVVMGAGPIGLLCIYALIAAGASRIFVTEPDAYRAERARAIGVDLIIDPSKDYPAEAIKDYCGETATHIYDCAGTASSIEEAAAIAGTHGTIIALGVPMGNSTIFPLTWFLKEIRLKFSFGYTYHEFGKCLDLLAKGAVNPEVIISDIMPLAEVDKAFKLLQGSGHTKILIDCQAG